VLPVITAVFISVLLSVIDVYIVPFLIRNGNLCTIDLC